ncbi:MAG TPA: spore coat protein [Chondromyces sp.]|nr:spore coat protein [Chondromyces sp.]
MMRMMAAHELLETSEALRTKAAEIEQHGFFANECQDDHLKSILKRHQQQMIQAYQQGINLLQGKGGQVTHAYPNFNTHNPQVGMREQMTLSAPNPNARALPDRTISTLALNAHKTGAVMGMVWANECVDPQIRSYHVQGANLCQEMAYEIWQWMNQNSYYAAPAFQPGQATQMAGTFQPMGDMNTYGNNSGMFS